MSLRRWAAGPGDEVRLVPVIQPPMPVGLAPVPQDLGQSLPSKTLLDLVYTVPSATSRASATRGAAQTIVALEQNPGPGGHPGRAFSHPNQLLEFFLFFPLFRLQPHCVLVPDHHRHPPPSTLSTRHDSLIGRFIEQLLKLS